MASKTEYEMLWKLGAQLGQDFNGTFSSAQKILTETQNEIQKLNKVQSDISAYSKQQQSIEKTKSKLELYEQQLQNVQHEMAASGEYNSALANKEIELKQKVEQTETAIAQKTAALDKLGNSLSEAGVDMTNLSTETQRLGEQTEDLKDKQEKAAEEAEKFGNKGSAAVMAVQEALVAAGITTLLKEIYQGFADCVTESAAWAGKIDETSKLYGIDTDSLQSLYYAAELVDVSVETIISSVQKNVKSMGEAERGSATYADAYKKLGVEITNTDGSLRDGMDVYWDVIDALGRMENEADRDSTAMQLLGRSAMQLNSLIGAGSGTIDEFSQKAHEAGYIMDQEMLETMCLLDDELMFQQKNYQALKNTIGTAFAPELTALTKLWNNILAGITKFGQEHPVLLKSIIAITAEFGLLVTAFTAYVAVKKLSNTESVKSLINIGKETLARIANVGATTAQTTATTAATAAQTGLNAAMSANPIGLVITAVAALTVGVIALTDAMGEQRDEVDQLSAASRAEYEELQRLKVEYQETCELYGESSYQAQELSWQIEDLSEQYENNKQALDEYKKSHEETIASYEEMVAQHEKQDEELRLEASSIQSLIARLESLSTQTDISAADQQEMLAIINALNEAVPGLSLSYEDLTRNVPKTIDAVKKLAEAEFMQREYEDTNEKIIEKMKERAALEKDLAVAQRERNAAYKEFVDVGGYIDESEGVVAATNFYERMEALEKYNDAEAKLNETSAAIKENEEKINELAEAMVGLNTVEEENGDITEDVTSLMESATNQLSNLRIAYDEAYDAAYDSVSGQYALWEKTAEVAVTSVETINESLESQSTYWSDYNKNLETLFGKTENIEGLAEIIASFADGSEESVNAVAGLAQATDAELAETVKAWQEREKQMAAVSESIASISTGYNEEFEKINDEIEKAVEEWNLDDESAEAARLTMEAYINELKTNTPKAVSSARAVAEQIKAAWNMGTISSVFHFAGESIPLRGYATGSDYALPGAALVGENGPEMVMFRGGERVYNAAETRGIMAEPYEKSNGAIITISPVFQFEGAADDNDDNIKVASEQIVAMVLDALDEAGLDARRGAYA